MPSAASAMLNPAMESLAEAQMVACVVSGSSIDLGLFQTSVHL